MTLKLFQLTRFSGYAKRHLKTPGSSANSFPICFLIMPAPKVPATRIIKRNIPRLAWVDEIGLRPLAKVSIEMYRQHKGLFTPEPTSTGFIYYKPTVARLPQDVSICAGDLVEVDDVDGYQITRPVPLSNTSNCFNDFTTIGVFSQ